MSLKLGVRVHKATTSHDTSHGAVGENVEATGHIGSNVSGFVVRRVCINCMHSFHVSAAYLRAIV